MTVSSFPTIVNIINSTSSTDFSTNTAISTPLLPDWIRIATLICMILIDISAFFGNLLVIFAFFRTRRLQTVTNYFIASLAFADALVAVAVLPLSIHYYRRDHSWKLGLILCDLWVSSDVLLCTSSILNLTCISVDRYMAITRPLTYSAYRSKFLARIMILLVWIMSIVITCPPIFGWRDANRRHTVEHEYKCDLNTARGYVVYSALGSFYIPAVIMIFVYIRIFMVVYDRQNLIKNFHKNNDNHNNPSSSIKIRSKANQNGTITNIHALNQSQDLFNCCSCFQKPFKKNQSLNCRRNQLQLPMFPTRSLETKRAPNKTRSSSTLNTPSSVRKNRLRGSILCHSCTMSTKKFHHTSDDINYRFRRNYLSYIGAEYQFRSCDSPCYELKKFHRSLPSSIRYRSHSFDHSAINNENNSNLQLLLGQKLSFSTILNDHQTNEKNNMLSYDKQDEQSSINYVKKSKESENDLTLSIEKVERSKDGIGFRSTEYSSLINKDLINNTLASNEKLLSSQRVCQSNPTKSKPMATITYSLPLADDLNKKHKVLQKSNTNNSSTKSKQSVNSMRVKSQPSQSSLYGCCCCFKVGSMRRDNIKKPSNELTPNQSLTLDDDDDDDDKLSSNDTNNRALMTVTSNPSSRVIENSNQTTIFSSSIHRNNYSQTASGTGNHASHDVNRRERIRFMKEQKTAKTLAVVVGGFILFWLPFFIMYVIPQEKHEFTNQTVTLITWLGYFNSVINPFIYAYCSKQFRNAFWNTTFGICIKNSNTSLPVSSKKQQVQQRRLNV